MAVGRIFGSDGAATMNLAGAASGSGIHSIIGNRWTADISQTLTRVKGYGDLWSSCKGGTKTASGTIGGQLKYNVASTAPNIVGILAAGSPSTTFQLTALTGCTYTIASTETVVYSRAGINHANESDVTTEFNWEINSGSGALGLVETWDET